MVMDSGAIVETGTYSELMGLNGKLTALVETETECGPARSDEEGKEEGEEEAGVAKEADKKEESKDDNSGELVEEETRDEGRVKMSVYVAYVRAAGVWMFMLVIGFFMLFPMSTADHTAAFFRRKINASAC